MPVAPIAAAPASRTAGPDAGVPLPSAGFAAAFDRALTPVPGSSQAASGHAPAAPLARSVTLGEMIGSTSLTMPAAPRAQHASTEPLASVGTVPAAGEDHVLAAAERYLGVPYRWGGTDPATGLDCSGFVQRVYADLGVSLPRVSADQARAGAPVPSLTGARPGDLLFWNGSPNHIGIYAGDGRMIVSPHTGAEVRYQDLPRTPDAIRRVL